MTDSSSLSNALIRSIGKAFLESQEQNEEAKELIKLLMSQVAILSMIAKQESESPYVSDLIDSQELLKRYKSFLDNRSSSRKEFIKNLAYIARHING